MDFFASDAFLTALAKDYYGSNHVDIGMYDVPGGQVRLAAVDGGKVLTTGPFYDYVKPDSCVGTSRGAISYLPKLVSSVIPLPDAEPAQSVPSTSQEPAPLVVWERFATWDDYLSLIRKRSSGLLRNQRRRFARMSEEHGEPTFIFNNSDIEALNQCVTWKVQQYEGGHETLEDVRALRMLRSLFEDGHLVMSTLQLGDRYIAVQAGFLWQEDYLALIPAYDPAFAKFGIGKELLLRMLEYGYHHGHKSFDFLQGAEPYKWDFATHVQLIESVGRPPLVRHSREVAERFVKQRLLAMSPGLFFRIKRLVLSVRRVLQRDNNIIG